jgi:glycerol-3-phosphate dehydrogenase
VQSTRDDSRLGPAERARTLDRFDDETFDLVVIGAGVTGLGAALDAAGRGLSVAVIEQRDLASGTSSRSSKLIHGGLRYLEQLNFRLVREALRERSLLLTRLAPHLVSPVAFLYPLKHRIWERAYVGAGVLLYGLLAAAGGNPLPRHRHLTRRGALELIPALRPDALVGGIQYWDASVDDARFAMTLARSAAACGAAIATSVRALGVDPHDGRHIRVHARCGETGRALALRGRSVVNATGVWSDRIRALAADRQLHIRASKGIHLVVPRHRIAASTGMIIRTETSVLFLIPWDRHWIIGTTDTDWNLDLAHPAASRADIRYLLSHINRVLAEPLTYDDIEGVYAGLRPLLTGESDATSKLSREHAVAVTAPGFVTVAGGKYTTYRVMARDAVDAAVAGFPESPGPSRTDDMPLVGAEGFRKLAADRVALAERSGLSGEVIDRLLGRYGDRIEDVLAVIEQRPELGDPIPGGGGYLGAEIRYAASHEAALHLNDVLTRRTRISIETLDRGVEAAGPTATLMAEVHGWGPATIQRELQHYRARVAAERESQTMEDDQTADAARMGAPDVRRLGLPPP